MMKFRRIISFLLTLVLLAGMLPPVSVRAEEPETLPQATEPSQAQTLPAETAAATEPIPAESAEETTEPAMEETAPAETEQPETEPAATEPVETQPEETRPALEPEGYTAPRIPRYWYITEEEYTWTEDVTVVEPDEDGSFRSYDTTQTFRETYHVRHEVGAEAAEFAALSGGNNTYYFTEFADLEQLAQDSYDSPVVAVYRGSYPFTVQRSITLPENLQLQFAGDRSSMIIPEGVTFANTNGSGTGSLHVDDLTVGGIFRVRDSLFVYGSLKVTGQLRLEQATMVLVGAVPVTGHENVVCENYIPRWAYSYIDSEAELKSAVSAAKNDTTGWEYLLEITTNNGDVTLKSNLTIPENVQLNVYGSGGRFLIASGYTLTVNAFYCYIGSPVVVNGTLKNNCSKVYVWSPITVNGSYSGTGALYVNMETFDYWEEALTGMDLDRTAVSEANWGDWWVVRDLNDQTQLAAPLNVAWHKRVVRTKSGTQVMDGKGHIYWKSTQPNDDQILIRFYDAETYDLIRTWNCSFGGQPTDDRSVDAFLDIDCPSGSYYFTITSVPKTGSNYVESRTGRSPVWDYVQSDYRMPVCQDLQLNFPVCSWKDPYPTDTTTTHQIELYYSATEDGSRRTLSRNFGFTGNTFQIGQSIYQNMGAGWYSFRVRAVPNDILGYRIGEWSEISEPFYYDPDNFTYNESWITSHIGPGPAGTGVEKFVATNGNVIRLENDFTVPEGVVMDINGGSLIVPAGKTLTVDAQQLAIYYGGSLIVEEGGTLILNTEILLYAENGTVDVRGDFVCGPDGAVVNFHQQGIYGGQILGVPKENKILSVWLDGFSAYWEEGLEAFENSDYGWTKLEIRDDVLLERDLVTPDRSEIGIASGSSLTVLDQVTLTVSRHADIYLAEDSAFCNNGTLRLYGSLLVHGDAVNTASVELMKGEVEQMVSTLLVYEDGSFRNKGTVTVRPWADVRADGKWTGNAPENLGGNVFGDALDMTQAEFTAALAAAKKAGEPYTLDRTVVLTKAMTLDHPVNVTENGMIKLRKGASLTVNKELTLSNGADLHVFEGAKLVNNSTIYCYSTAEAYGYLSCSGTYTQGEKGSLKVGMNDGKPGISGIAKKYQTACFRPADTEQVLEAMTLEGYGGIEVWTDNLYLTEDLVIPANAVLIINPTWSDLQNGTRNDWVYLDGDVTVYGELHANAYYNGTPCNLEINGNVEVKSGGLLYVVGHVKNNGSVHVEVGGKYERYENFGGTWVGSTPSVDLSEADFRAAIKAGKQSITLTNNLVLTSDMTIPASTYVRIYSGGSLTVPAGVTLTMDSSGAIYGGILKVKTGGKLVLNSYIDLYDAATVNIQGTVQYGSDWAFFRHNYIEGMDGSSLSGVAPEHLTLSVHFTPYNKSHWQTCADLVENNEYPISFMIVTNGQVTLPRSMTIRKNTLVHVDGGTTLVIPEGMTLTNHGELYVWYNNSLKNYGTIDNRRGFYVMGSLYNSSEIQLNESGQAVESFFEVAEAGYLQNNGLVSVNMGGHLWMMGTWEGIDPARNGGGITMGRYQPNSEGAWLSAGQSLNLKVWDCMESKALSDSQVTWSLPEEYAAYATITAKGKLTVRNVTEQVTVKAVAVLKDSGREIVTTVHLYPSVTHMEILEGDMGVTGQTVAVDADGGSRMFALKLYPLDLNNDTLKDGWCSWTISDKTGAYAAYDITDGVLTVTPTGKTGTVTVKVSYNVGTKKSVSFKLAFNRYAQEVEVLNDQTQLAGGSKLTLTARVLPLYAAKTNVVWSLKDPADKAYVTLSKNVLKAKTVYDAHDVTLVATSGDGMATAEYTVTIMPKDTGILILEQDGRNVTKGTVYVDLNQTTEIDLSARFFDEAEPIIGDIWKSSSTKVAVVSNGRVTFLKPGTVTITATVGSSKATVTVKAARLASSVQITGAEEVASGKAVQLKAVLENAASSKVTWSILTGGEWGKISSSGKFTAAKNLTAAKPVIIRATAADGSGAYDDFVLTVRPQAQGVQVYTLTDAVTFSTESGWFDRSNTSLRWDMTLRGNTVDLAAKVFPYYGQDSDYNAIQKVTWKSSAPKVAAIRTDGDRIWVECLKPGTATITATAADGSGKKISFKLTVVKTAEKLILADQQVKGGKSLNLAKLIRFDPAGVSEKGLTWTITKGSSYATLSASGTLKAKKTKVPVTVEVTVAAKEGKAEPITCRITILP